MSEKTNIAWCDSTLNFWEGCTKVSAGCHHCYAEARDKRFTGGKLWGKGAQRRKSKSAVKLAFKMNSEPWICDGCGHATAEIPESCSECDWCGCHRRRIFSLSLGDWLDDEVPMEWFAEMLDTIRQCDQVTWMLCTKRPENWLARLDAILEMEIGSGVFTEWIADWINGKAPKNIILLASVENQQAADERIPALLDIPAACRGLSLEPLLGSVELRLPFSGPQAFPLGMGIQWLIIGGESGTNARPCSVEWIRSLVEQGKNSGCATFVKQLGARPYQPPQHDGATGYEFPITDKKGGEISEWPHDIQIQQWPKGF